MRPRQRPPQSRPLKAKLMPPRRPCRRKPSLPLLRLLLRLHPSLPERSAEEEEPLKPAPAAAEDDLEALEKELAEAGVQLSASGDAADLDEMDDV